MAAGRVALVALRDPGHVHGGICPAGRSRGEFLDHGPEGRIAENVAIPARPPPRGVSGRHGARGAGDPPFVEISTDVVGPSREDM